MERQRVRLSNIDLLPPEADQDIVWAVAEIEGNGRHLKDILEEFNARLADRGIGSISPSSWSRYAVKKRAAFQQLKETREISNAIASSLKPGDDDALTTTISQFAKTAMYRLFESGKSVDSKSIMEIGRALQSIEQAKKASAAHKKQAEKEAADKAVKTIEAVAAEAGLSSQRIAQLRREFLGVRPKAKSVPNVDKAGDA